MSTLFFRAMLLVSLLLMVVSGGSEPVFAQDVPTDTSTESTAPEKQEATPPARETTPPVKEARPPPKETKAQPRPAAEEKAVPAGDSFQQALKKLQAQLMPKTKK